MKNETHLRWSHLPQTTAVFTDVLPSVQRCLLYDQGEAQVRLLLLADGICAVATHPGTTWWPDAIAEAIGRIVATHANDQLQQGTDWVQEIRAEASALSEEHAWPGMPGIRTSIQARNECARVLLAEGAEAVVMIMTNDVALPISWSLFTTSTPARSLLLAVGRTILAHQWAARPDGA